MRDVPFAFRSKLDRVEKENVGEGEVEKSGRRMDKRRRTKGGKRIPKYCFSFFLITFSINEGISDFHICLCTFCAESQLFL